MKTTIVRMALLTGTCVVSLRAAQPVYRVKMQKIGNEPAMINGPDPFINPRANGVAGIKTLTINPLTGILYGMDTYVNNNGRAATFLADTSIISTPSAPQNAKFAYVSAIYNTQYSGAVRGGAKDRDPPAGAAITFNPDLNEGVYVVQTMTYNTLYLYHWTMQDLSVGWGHTVELANTNTCALYADTYIAYGCCSRGTREGVGYLDHATASGGTYSDVYRYVWYYKESGTARDELRVVHVATSFSDEPSDTTLGRIIPRIGRTAREELPGHS